ncbi:tetratricopeptide repeat protein [Bryobacter aggregatus]|uniref:tetratricopeptide repeat protein n=1 Tax=Bryobacter aggregatus TaxID=360054 RepID=UPI00068DC76B|nr:hypothetical protein [Bryobacter aggregatus]
MGPRYYAPLLAWLASIAFAQHGGLNPGQITPRLWPGYGELRFQVTTDNAEARTWANQGMRLVYAFNHPEAAASFKKAAELDANCAMCWWGLGLALGNNINAPLMPENAGPAYEASQKALSLLAKASPREQAYIRALAQRYAAKNPEDRSNLDRSYALAMRELAQQYPDDLDAQTLAADALMNLTPWKLWTHDGKPNAYTLEIVSLLESVLQREPDHLGANHIYIHAVEASLTPERALPSADILAGLAPASGHLVHMPAHVYMRVGNYARSAELNRKAAALDKAYFETVGAPTYYKPYWIHNLHFLSASESMMGRYEEARVAIGAVARELEPLARMMPQFESALAMPYMLEVRFQKWDKILTLEEPASFSVSVNNIYQFARGMALAAKGDAKAATEALATFRKQVAAIAPDRGFGLNLEKDVMGIAVEILEAKIALARKDTNAAIAALERAVAAEDALSYDEPADWYYPPSREALGAVLLQAGKKKEAEAIFRQELANNRQSGRALFGLMEALQAQGKLEAAAMIAPRYEAAWKNADAPLRLSQLF